MYCDAFYNWVFLMISDYYEPFIKAQILLNMLFALFSQSSSFYFNIYLSSTYYLVQLQQSIKFLLQQFKILLIKLTQKLLVGNKYIVKFRCIIFIVTISVIILIRMNQILDNSYFKNTIKDKYSFPKSQRFPQLKSNYKTDFFQSSSVQKPRSTSFGYGSKFDFFKDVKKGPSPFEYSVKDNYQSNKNLSFGLGRQQIKFHSYIDPEKIKTPRAIDYNADYLKIKKKQPSCCILGRNPRDSFIQPDINPDPSKYNPIDTFYSRRKRSAQFGFGSSKRFNYQDPSINKMVGPGTYTISPKNQSKLGKIGVATRKTYAVQQIQRSISPGPKYIIK